MSDSICSRWWRNSPQLSSLQKKKKHTWEKIWTQCIETLEQFKTFRFSHHLHILFCLCFLFLLCNRVFIYLRHIKVLHKNEDVMLFHQSWSSRSSADTQPPQAAVWLSTGWPQTFFIIVCWFQLLCCVSPLPQSCLMMENNGQKNKQAFTLTVLCQVFIIKTL